MDQVLQAAGFAFQQRQDLVGFPHLPHVVPGRTEHLGAVPDHGGQHHDDGRIQRGDRQDAPADRHRADQPDDAGTAARGETRRPFHGLVVPRHGQGQFTPPCEFVRSAAPSRDRAAPLRRFRPSRSRTWRCCGCSMVRNGSGIGRHIRWPACRSRSRSQPHCCDQGLRPVYRRREFPRDRARRDRRQRRRDNECCGPRKVGAAVHRQNSSPYDGVWVGKKGSIHLAEAGERWPSCQRHGRRQWCAALDLLPIETAGAGRLLRRLTRESGVSAAAD